MSCGTATERQCVRRHCDWRRIGTAFLSKLLLLSQTVKHDLMYFSFMRFVFFFGRLKLRPFVSRAMDSIVLSTHLLITKTFLFIYLLFYFVPLRNYSLAASLSVASVPEIWISLDWIWWRTAAWKLSEMLFVLFQLSQIHTLAGPTEHFWIHCLPP